MDGSRAKEGHRRGGPDLVFVIGADLGVVFFATNGCCELHNPVLV